MDVRGITIDEVGARDRGLSLWADQDARGWTVTVCVSNIADAISKDSTFDKTAYRRVEAQRHASGRSSPMLPRRFSEGSSSIVPGRAKSVVAVRIRLDHEFERQFSLIDESMLVNSVRLAFPDIPKILEEKNGDLYPLIDRLDRLSNALLEKRCQSLAVGYRHDMRRILPDEDGQLQHTGVSKIVGVKIAQEIAILANAEIARFCAENNIPILYRNQVDRPPDSNRNILANEESGVEPHDNRSSYGSVSEGHRFLDLPFYTHGMLPIRRYADLVVQRQIFAYIRGRPFPYTIADIQKAADHINQTLEDRYRAAIQSELERVDQKSKRSIQSGRLNTLSDKEFERILKNSIQSKILKDHVAREFESRIHSGRSTVTCLYIALLKTGEVWSALRRAAIRHLIDKPYKGVSVVAMASQMDGWGKPIYKIHRKGSDGHVLHEVQIIFEKIGYYSRMVRATSLKLAKQRAMVEAIASAAGEIIPPWDESCKNIPPNAPPWESENPVNALAEYCLSLEVEKPEYSISRSGGTDHAPIFIATGRALTFEVRSEPKPSKKAAKRQVATKIIDLVRAKYGQEKEDHNENAEKL